MINQLREWRLIGSHARYNHLHNESFGTPMMIQHSGPHTPNSDTTVISGDPHCGITHHKRRPAHRSFGDVHWISFYRGILDTMKRRCFIFTAIMLITLSACGGPEPETSPVSQQMPSATARNQAPTKVTAMTSATPNPTPNATSTSIPPTVTPTPGLHLCSPLPEVPITELRDVIVNPYLPPRWGSDDAHQGVDFAILDPDYLISLGGSPVQAVLEGRVASVMEDRFPYGNAVLVETSLDALPDYWITHLQLPTPAPTLPPHPSLTCPQTGAFLDWELEKRSLYLLYAHMEEPPSEKVDDYIYCGDSIGTMGDTGNALNPHLHLEIRIGPSGVSFPSLAHYETRAKPEEMEAYCIWRVSGVFQLIDPMTLFDQIP